MKAKASQMVSGIVLASGLIPLTWVCFGPIFAFGRGVCFGITAFLVLNPDGPPPDVQVYTWDDLKFVFFPWRFVIALVIWLIAVTVFVRIIRCLQYRPGRLLNIGPDGNPA
jgi:hypothetical protein